MFDFDMSEESRITEIGFSAWTNIISVVRLISSSSAATTLLEGVLQTGWKHR